MLEHLPFSSLMALLTAVCCLFLITGGWLFLVVTRSSARTVAIQALGVSINIELGTNNSGEQGGQDG